MKNNIRDTVDLTSYLFSLPSASVILVAMVVAALVFGLAINLIVPSENILFNTVRDGALLLLIPAVLTVMIVKMLIRRMPLRRIMATAFGGEVVYGFAYIFALLVADISEFYGELVLLIGAALVFVLWYAIARLIFILKYRSILFAIIQLLFYVIFLFYFQTFTITDATIIDWAAKAYISAFILLGALYLFFMIVNAPMKKIFGMSSTDAFSMFINQWIYRKNDLEKAFEKVGENAMTTVGVVGFRRAKDRIMFIVPNVHFGPFGNLGGSEFSDLISKEGKKKYRAHTFVFHGTVTHDLNPTSSSEIDKIMDTVGKILKRSKYTNSTVGLSIAKIDECTAETLVLGDSSFTGVTRAPLVTEDINFGLGLSMALEAEKHVKTSVIADQHNAETGELTSFEPGSEIGYRYITAVKDSVSKKLRQEKLRIGISEKHPESESLGQAGVKIAVISTYPQYVIVLMDSNGVTPEFRNKIKKEIRKLGNYKVGVYTTDTHQTNAIRGVLNPVKEDPVMLKAILEGVKEAVDDMQDATAFVDKEWFEIRAIGARHATELVSTVNSIVAVAKITAPLILIAAILIILAILSRI